MWEYILCYLGNRSISSCKGTRLSSQWVEVNKFDVNSNKLKFRSSSHQHTMKYLQLLMSFRSHRFFDVFEYNALEKHWGCFLCNHPDRAHNFVQVMNMIPYIVSEKITSTMFKKMMSFFMFLPLSGTSSSDRRTTQRKERRKMEDIQEMEK